MQVRKLEEGEQGQGGLSEIGPAWPLPLMEKGGPEGPQSLRTG